MSEREEFKMWLDQSGISYREDVALAAWQASKESSRKELEELRAKIAMQAEALNYLAKSTMYVGYAHRKAEEALSATAEEVAAWKEGIITEAKIEALGMLTTHKTYTKEWVNDEGVTKKIIYHPSMEMMQYIQESLRNQLEGNKK